MDTRLIYVDDSGHHTTNWVVYGWVEVRLEDWKPALAEWLRFRRSLLTDPGIPARYELHSSDFVGGRGNPTGRDEWDRRKALRGPIVESALDAINACSYISVGSAVRHAARRGEYAIEQTEVYNELIQLWDQQAKQARERYLVIMDGNGTATSYHGAHRSLDIDARHVIEDPLYSASSRSQWIQMADMVAYAAYMNVVQLPEKDWAWDWYSRLSGCDTNSGSLGL